jgi:hypothetical protein
LSDRKTVDRISYPKQKDKCRDDGTAYFEKCGECNARLLMCGHGKTKGGLCKPEKCKDYRVIRKTEEV